MSVRVVDVCWEEVMLAVGGSGEGARDGRKERPISIRYMEKHRRQAGR